MPKKPKIEPTFETFDPKEYLSQYYSKIDSENHGLMEFLVRAYKELPENCKFLEFGGGPTIYPLINVAPYVSKIHFADYLPENLKEVRLWKQNSSCGFDWTRFFMKALQLEGTKKVTSGMIRKREVMVRKKIEKFLFCNAFDKDPLGPKYRRYYDVVNTNFVTESITASKKIWKELVGNVCSLLKEDGTLIMTAIKEAMYYHVGKKVFPAVSVTEEDIIEVLTDLGFNEASIVVSAIPAEVMNEELIGYTGYKGLVFVRAKKSSI